MKLGEKIQKLRKEKGYSQEEFAKHIGIGRSTLANYEQGIRKPSYVMLELIAKSLNTTPSYLMGWDDNSKEGIMTIGKMIKQRREELGISQEELAKRVGYKSRSTINKIEKEINDITQSKVVEIANALNTAPAYLMGFENSSTNQRSIKDKTIYLLLADRCIAKIDHVCMCDKCRERGEPEIYITSLDGEYRDYLKFDELFNKNYVKAVSTSLDELIELIKKE